MINGAKAWVWRGFRPFSVGDWVLQRGILGFGTSVALMSLLWKLYDGEQLTWDNAKVDVAIKVFLMGPLWGLWMWWFMRGRYASKTDNIVEGARSELPLKEEGVSDR